METKIKQFINQLAITASSEIFETIKWSMENNKTFYSHVGNYWTNNFYNLFADVETDGDCITIKLESYDENENCIDVEVDEEYSDLNEESLCIAIEKLLIRNIDVV